MRLQYKLFHNFLWLLVLFFFAATASSAQDIQIKRTFSSSFANSEFVEFYPHIELNMKERMWDRVGKYFEKHPSIAEFNKLEPSAECPSLYRSCYLDVELEVPEAIRSWSYYYISENGVKKTEVSSLKGTLNFFMRGFIPKETWLSNPRVSGAILTKKGEGFKDGTFIVATKDPVAITSRDISNQVFFEDGLLKYKALNGALITGKPHEASGSIKPRLALEYKVKDQIYLFIKWVGFDFPCGSNTEVFKVEGNQLREEAWDLSGCDI